MPLLTTPAIVLASMKLGEADRLVTFFTEKKGKMKGVAQGARRMKSRFGAALEPFSHINLILFEKGGDRLHRVNQADITQSFQKLREAWDTIKRGSHMVHLVGKMTPDEEPNPAIYRLLCDGLSFMERGLNLPLSSLLFVIKLVHHSGYQPHWDSCLKCKAPTLQQQVYFSPPDGGTFCARCSHGRSHLISVSAGTLAFLRAMQRMDQQTVHRLKPTPFIQREIEALFGEHLAYISGRPLSMLAKEHREVPQLVCDPV